MSDPRDELVQHLGALRAFAVSLTRNTAQADDLVQDTLLKAWASIDKFQAGTNMRAWLFTILRNTFYSLHRKRKREVEDSDGEIAAAVAQKPDHDGRLQMHDFQTAFAQLTDEQREALVLVGANGFSYEDAAETCGVAVGTIKSRVNRGRTRLAALMHITDDDALEITDTVTAGIVAKQPAA
ncbi:MAG: RNA polymerase sigma factor [Pseudomonadota bacterium]